MVNCASGLVAYSISAGDLSIEEFPLGGDPPLHRRSDRPAGTQSHVVAVFERNDGSFAILFNSGTLRVVQDGRALSEVEVLTGDTYTVLLRQRGIVGGELLVPYQTVPQTAPAGVLLLDLENVSVKWRVEASRALFGVAQGGGRARLSDGTNAVQVDSLAGTSAVLRLADPSMTDWVIIR